MVLVLDDMQGIDQFLNPKKENNKSIKKVTKNKESQRKAFANKSFVIY